VAKIFILAGEASGDLHGSYLVKQLLKQQPDLQINAWGGKKMKTAGANILRGLDHLAFMGFTEVLKNTATVLENFKLCKKHISDLEPDVIVFIDYPGFNLRMAKWARAHGYKTIQYIAPAAWAWKEKRVEKIRQYIDELLVILPFEKAFFAKHDINAHFVGHPLIEQIRSWSRNPKFELPHKNNSKKAIALFPGSRIQEIKLILPKMTELVKAEIAHQYYIAVPDHLPASIYTEYVAGLENVYLVHGENYDLLSSVDAAIVSSGTATLEVALMNVPQVVCYQTNPLSFAIAKQLVKTKYISLVNLIANKDVVKELLQSDFTTPNLKNELSKLLSHDHAKKMNLEYTGLKEKLGYQSASLNAAKIILSSLIAS